VRSIFFANDMGGGNLLTPLIEQLRKKGNVPVLIASGPSSILWKRLGFCPNEVSHAVSGDLIRRIVSKYNPQVVVTGTSTRSTLEILAWSAAKYLKVPTIAMVDGWVKIEERFVRKGMGKCILPDHFGVIDQETAEVIKKLFSICSAKIHLVGHPHLQRIAAQLEMQRAGRSLGIPPVLVFFSSPRTDHEATHGVIAFSALIDQLKLYAPLTIFIKPHPREDLSPWENVIKTNVSFRGESIVSLASNSPSDELLLVADIVAGLPSSALIEAAFSGIPTLVIQLKEPNWETNPAIEYYLSGYVARDIRELKKLVPDLIARMKQPSVFIESPIIYSATARAFKAINHARLNKWSRSR